MHIHIHTSEHSFFPGGRWGLWGQDDSDDDDDSEDSDEAPKKKPAAKPVVPAPPCISVLCNYTGGREGWVIRGVVPTAVPVAESGAAAHRGGARSTAAAGRDSVALAPAPCPIAATVVPGHRLALHGCRLYYWLVEQELLLKRKQAREQAAAEKLEAHICGMKHTRK